VDNKALFESVRALGLERGRYAITGSGPLGIRGIRVINDVDLVVDDELFEELAALHPSAGGRVEVSSTIEAFRESAFPPEPGVPTVAEQIASAETIDGLSFVTLGTVLAIKRSKGREKDRADIATIEKRYGCL
jgi:hypothetical protein